MRAAVNRHVSGCSVCRLLTHPPSRKENEGEHIATEPNAAVMADYSGPWHSMHGRHKYFILFVNCASRYAFTLTTASTSDAETLRALVEYRKHLCGLPAKIGVDNAILTSNSKSRAFLEEHNVSIVHGHPYVSRSQSKAEKTIGTIARLILKYQTERPTTSFATSQRSDHHLQLLTLRFPPTWISASRRPLRSRPRLLPPIGCGSRHRWSLQVPRRLRRRRARRRARGSPVRRRRISASTET